jgi:hypothetical protein
VSSDHQDCRVSGASRTGEEGVQMEINISAVEEVKATEFIGPAI